MTMHILAAKDGMILAKVSNPDLKHRLKWIYKVGSDKAEFFYRERSFYTKKDAYKYFKDITAPYRAPTNNLWESNKIFNLTKRR